MRPGLNTVTALSIKFRYVLFTFCASKVSTESVTTNSSTSQTSSLSAVVSSDSQAARMRTVAQTKNLR